jgi:hypothetical protein
MRRIFLIAACLFMIGEIQIANAQITEMVTELVRLCNKLLETYQEAVNRGDVELAQKKKDALASIDAALIHMSAIKTEMAANIRCLGQAPADEEKFKLCFHGLETENNDLRVQVRNLKSSIDVADPHWISRHAEEARQIYSLYYEKLAIAGRVLVFTTHSIFQSVPLVEPGKCEQLAASLDAEANQLKDLEVSIGKKLRT